MLALVGIVIGVYFAVSGASSSPTRLVSAPVVDTAGGATSPAATPSIDGTQRSSQSNRATPAPVSSLPSSPVTPATPSAARAVSDTIQRHFSLITHHQFSAAYALLAPSLQTGESSWVAAHQADGIYNVSVAVDAAVHSSSSATASIVKMTTLDGHGCKKWSGNWGLVKIDGQWRISESNLTAAPC